MPGQSVPKKDVVHCEKRRRGVCTREQPTVSEWGNPVRRPLITRKRGNQGK